MNIAIIAYKHLVDSHRNHFILLTTPMVPTFVPSLFQPTKNDAPARLVTSTTLVVEVFWEGWTPFLWGLKISGNSEKLETANMGTV